MSSTREPEWSEEDRDLVVALEIVKNMTGPNGEWMPDATSDGADPNNYDVPFRFVASGPHTNWAEKTKADAVDQYRKDAGDKANLNGLYWTVERRDY